MYKNNQNYHNKDLYHIDLDWILRLQKEINWKIDTDLHHTQ